MVLVRKSELACRNDWDQDLWEPGSVVDSTASVGVDRPLGTIHRAPAFTADMIPDPVDDVVLNGEIFTDKIQSVVLSRRPPESTPTASPTAKAGAEPEDASSISRSDVREARRRRQEQRTQDQRRYQQALSEEAGKLLSAREEPAQPGSREPVPPATPSVVPEKSTLMTSKAESHKMPALPPGGGDRDSGSLDWVQVRRTAGRFDERVIPSNSPTLPPLDRTEPSTEPLPIDELRMKESAHSSALPLREQHVREREPEFVEPPISLPPTKQPAGTPVAGRRPRRSETLLRDAESEQRLPLPFSVDPVDQASVAGSIPRCCATCRDFKRVGDGARGWCVNPHAFTQRRMVESDHLSCRSSIGSWWLPSDDLWLERVDMSHHGRPTPLLDELYDDGQVESQELESGPF